MRCLLLQRLSACPYLRDGTDEISESFTLRLQSLRVGLLLPVGFL
jgi:hypothetical protein